MGFDKLRTPPQVPPLFNGTPISIVGDAKRLIETSRAVQDQIVQSVQPRVASFANVLLPLAQAENTMKVESEILGFYKDVSPDPELRHASGEAQVR
jgi:metallopeptidase MepB